MRWIEHQKPGIAVLRGFMILLIVLGLLMPTAVAQQDVNLVIVPVTAQIYVGETQQYRAYLSYDGGTTLGPEVTDECMWTADRPDIAEAGTESGSFTGISPGAASIRAFYTEQVVVRAPLRLEGQARLSVREPVEQVRIWMEVIPSLASVQVGETQQYEAYLNRSDTAEVLNVTDVSDWVIADDIATAVGNGRYRGDRVGETLVTASYEGIPPGLTGTYTASDDAILRVWEEDVPDDTPEDPPETEDLPIEKILDRQPGYLVWSEPQFMAAPGDSFVMSYNDWNTDGSSDRYPKVFYWNETYEKWVALASYPLPSNEVRARNDGNYSGWFVVFGCIQPRFTDVAAGYWAEPIINRMNGLGLISGYPNPNNPASLVRPAGVNRTITRAELTTVVAKILGLAPGDTHFYPTLTYKSDFENNLILQANYTDADDIAGWARPFIASMTDAGLVRPKGSRFAPQDEMTRIEAAVLISDALRDVPGFGTPADLSVFTDAAEVPSWAVGAVAVGTVSGYDDGTLRPNQPINRAESMTLLLKLLRGLGW
jgi:hypothetical protein